jgi:dihydroflavonol-4-reductase
VKRPSSNGWTEELLMGYRTLVTGSTGFIGSQLCWALASQGHQVRAFHRATSPLLVLEGLPVEHAIGDITQPETLDAAFKDIEVVFHAAARVGKRRAAPHRLITIDGTRNLLQAAARAGVKRVVHTSSVAALGLPEEPKAGQNRRPLMNENYTWNLPPEDWQYGYAKYQAELEVQKAVARGLDVVIVNPAVVVGAGDINQISGKVILQIARGRLPVTIEGGLNVVHIQDVVAGHLAALELGHTGERYILGGENIPHTEFFRQIAAAVGVRPPWLKLPGHLVRLLSGPVKLADQLLNLPFSGEALRRAGYYFYFDSTKSRRELALPEPRPACQAITEAYQWYRDHKMI